MPASKVLAGVAAVIIIAMVLLGVPLWVVAILAAVVALAHGEADVKVVFVALALLLFGVWIFSPAEDERQQAAVLAPTVTPSPTREPLPADKDATKGPGWSGESSDETAATRPSESVKDKKARPGGKAGSKKKAKAKRERDGTGGSSRPAGREQTPADSSKSRSDDRRASRPNRPKPKNPRPRQPPAADNQPPAATPTPPPADRPDRGDDGADEGDDDEGEPSPTPTPTPTPDATPTTTPTPTPDPLADDDGAEEEPETPVETAALPLADCLAPTESPLPRPMLDLGEGNPFYTPLPDDAKLLPDDVQQDYRAEFGSLLDPAHGIRVEQRQFSAVLFKVYRNGDVYDSRCNRLAQNVPFGRPSGPRDDLNAGIEGKGWPLASWMHAPKGDAHYGEGHLALYNPETGAYGEFIDAQPGDGSLSYGWGGYVADIRPTDGTSPGPNEGVWQGGTAFGLNFMSFVITEADIRHAVDRYKAGDHGNAYIRHIIGYEAYRHHPNKWTYPASRTDMTGIGPNPECPGASKVSEWGVGGCADRLGNGPGVTDQGGLPMGGIIRLAPSVDVQSQVSGDGTEFGDMMARIIARTIQRHGMTMTDQTEAGLNLLAETVRTPSGYGPDVTPYDKDGDGGDTVYRYGEDWLLPMLRQANDNGWLQHVDSGRNMESDEAAPPPANVYRPPDVPVQEGGAPAGEEAPAEGDGTGSEEPAEESAEEEEVQEEAVGEEEPSEEVASEDSIAEPEVSSEPTPAPTPTPPPTPDVLAPVAPLGLPGGAWEGKLPAFAPQVFGPESVTEVPEPSRKGGPSIRISTVDENTNGDGAVRAHLKGPVQEPDTVRFYGFSMRLQEDFPAYVAEPAPSWLSLVEYFGPPFNNPDGSGRMAPLHIGLAPGDGGMVVSHHTNNQRDFVQTHEMKKGVWYDFVVEVSTSRSAGYFHLWRKEAEQTEYADLTSQLNLPMLYADQPGLQFIPHQYRNQGNIPGNLPATHFLAEVKIGDSFAAVAP